MAQTITEEPSKLRPWDTAEGGEVYKKRTLMTAIYILASVPHTRGRGRATFAGVDEDVDTI